MTKNPAIGSTKPFSRALCALLLGFGLMHGAVANDTAVSTPSNPIVVTLTAEQERDLLASLQQANAITPIELERFYYPSLGAGIPSGFGANWGDAMLSASFAHSDRSRSESDGGMSFTAGLLNARSLFGVEVSANLLSLRQFGSNWNFDAKVHRMLYEGPEGALSVALGRNNFACSGSDACDSRWPTSGIPASVASNYLALSGITPVRNPFGSGTIPLNITLGMGNGNFSNDMNSGARYSVFGDIGILLHDQIGTSVGWSGKGLNANFSFVPVRKFPLVINVLFADITNRTPAGFNVIVTAGMPFNFLN